MEWAIKRSILWRDSGSTVGNSMVVRRHPTAKGYTWKIYAFGDLGLNEVFMRLPELFLQKGCKTIKSEKKIRVVRLPLRIDRTITTVYVKQHNALSFRHRLASIFCASAALRSLSGAATLRREGFATARPLTVVELRRRGVLIKSFYVSEEIAGAKTSTDYWREKLLPLTGIEGRLKRRAVLRALAQLLRSLHERKIYHNDLKASNILALDEAPTSEGIFSLIDLQGVRKCFYLSRRRRIKNLAQINRTLGNHLTGTEKLRFIRAYVGDTFSARRKTKHLVQDILKETSRQMIRERLRHPSDEIDRIESGGLTEAGRSFSRAKDIAPLIAANFIGVGL